MIQIKVDGETVTAHTNGSYLIGKYSFTVSGLAEKVIEKEAEHITDNIEKPHAACI